MRGWGEGERGGAAPSRLACAVAHAFTRGGGRSITVPTIASDHRRKTNKQKRQEFHFTPQYVYTSTSSPRPPPSSSSSSPPQHCNHIREIEVHYTSVPGSPHEVDLPVTEADLRRAPALSEWPRRIPSSGPSRRQIFPPAERAPSSRRASRRRWTRQHTPRSHLPKMPTSPRHAKEQKKKREKTNRGDRL